ncbi:sodium-coupled neutral amino acid transporter 7-like isoform X1 [Tachypleus tridentatus]|uniref:sodium-coupled neutral amino acid transporter 7-like isoform X1 n=1 Tax=Tachypleus tridentatus TaxID=6853 RepID=UPI003FD4749B
MPHKESRKINLKNYLNTSYEYHGNETDPLLGITVQNEQTSDHNENRQNRVTGVKKKDKKDVSGTSWYVATFVVVNAALGAGLLNFPQAYHQAGGVLVAMCVQLVLIIFIIAALLILAHCSDANTSSTYQEVVLQICGEKARRVCAALIALYCYGTCITFVIIIGDQFDTVFQSLYGADYCHYWYMKREFAMIVSCCVIILPMCFPRRIDFLKYASTFGVVAVLYVVFLIIYKYFEGKFEPGSIRRKPDIWTDVFVVVPTICFGYQCHVSCVPVYSCLADRRVTTFLKTVLVAIGLCLFTYSVAASFGYLTFGSNVASDILVSYNAKDPVVLIGVVAFAVKTYTTYPILLFCGRTAIDDLYLQVRGSSEEQAQRNERHRRITIALFWFASSLLLAVLIPNIGVVIRVLGSLAAVFIFVFPGTCLLNLTLTKDPELIMLKNKLVVIWAIFFIAVGACIFGLVLTQSLIRGIFQ